MKTEKKILIAFILNFSFSVFEFLGGAFTGSVAIISDAVHDMGDAITICISYLLERKSKKHADYKHTYGYTRYSVLGCVVTELVLLIGSIVVIYNAILRIIDPVPINYNGMIIFAVVGVVVNFFAVFFTRGGGSLNQKAVNLHMLEDVLGWVVVLVGAVVMRFTDFRYIDPIMSIALACFIIVNAVKHLKEVADIFLEKTPKNIDVNELCNALCDIEGVADVHHIHIRSFDGQINSATMHIVTDYDTRIIKQQVRQILNEKGIKHATIETEQIDEICNDKNCLIELADNHHHHHHHHEH